jgi:anti-sigma factor RsiW
MSLSCEEVELSLLEPGRSEEVRAHLQGCEKCRAFEKDLGAVESLAALPEPTGAERAKLVGLAPRTLSLVRAQEHRWSVTRRFAGFALAAGLGALVAGVALRANEQPHSISHPQLVSDAVDVPLVLVDDGVMADSDDDVEIAWPTPNEGDVP